MKALETLEKFFETYKDIVYITDMDTNTIVYLNRIGRRSFKLMSTEDYLGRKCYEILHDKSSKCEFCNDNRLSEGIFNMWTYTNEKLNLYCTLMDTLILEDGKRYRVEIASDTDQEMKQKKTLEEMTTNETIINEALDLALTETDPNKSINIMLAYLGRELHSDRTYIFEEQPDGTYSNTYEWCADGVSPQIRNLQNLPAEIVKVWNDEFDLHRNILISNIEQYRKISEPMYNVLKPQDIQTLVVGPLTINNRRIGFYGVDNPPYEAIENISTMYEVLGHFISALLRHRDNVAKLENLSFIDQLTGLHNRHALDDFLNKVDPGKSICYFFADINGLKKTNDTKGHDAGDELIRETAHLLSDFFSPVPVFRMGGDEFLSIHSGISREDAEKKRQDLVARLAEAKITCAVGMIWKPDGTGKFDDLFQEADAEMYKDKRAFYGERRKSVLEAQKRNNSEGKEEK